MNIVELDGLIYRNDRKVWLDVSALAIPLGSVFGVIGPAGSGKTTLARLISAQLQPSEGDVYVNGASVHANASMVRRWVGYLPTEVGVYPTLSTREYLKFFAGCFGMPRDESARTADDLLALMDLTPQRNVMCELLTRGQRQRLGLARTLVHDPPLLVLDEPFADLDPRAVSETRDLITQLHEMGKSIVLCTSRPVEADGLCTHAVVLKEGKRLFDDIWPELRPRLMLSRHLRIRFLGDANTALSVAKETSGVSDAKLESSSYPSSPGLDSMAGTLQEIGVVFTGGFGDATGLLRALVRSAVQVVSFDERGDQSPIAADAPEFEHETPAAALAEVSRGAPNP